MKFFSLLESREGEMGYRKDSK